MTRTNFRLILVTGMPRSGTTAVGKMISLGHGVASLHEPFNYHVGLVGIQRYFEFIEGAIPSYAKLDAYVKDIRSLRLSFKTGVFPGEHGTRRLFKRLVGGRAKNSFRICRLNPFLNSIIWKDPFASLIAGYLSKSHGIDVLVTVRNPWAVAASFKRMQWGFDLHNIISMLPADLRIGIPTPLPGRNDYVANGAILWHIIYAYLLKCHQEHINIHFVDINDVVHDPIKIYKRLYAQFSLPWDDHVASNIRRYYQSQRGPSKPGKKKAHVYKRDIESVNTYWKSVLDEEEFKLVSQINERLWSELRHVC